MMQPVVEFSGFSLGRDIGSSWEPLVTDMTLTLRPGEVLGLVGESGSGKSLSALSCLGLLPAKVRQLGGSLSVLGRDTSDFSEDDWREVRGAQVSMIFQDPMTSLDPCFTVGSQIVETIRAHESVSTRVAHNSALEMLRLVGITDPESRYEAYPHELSGGLRQRAMIAAALVMKPKVLVADEPTTALDVTTQAAIIELVLALQREMGMSVLWISHDLAVVANLAHRVAVMYAGELVEVAETESLFAQPKHPYTRGLIDSARVRAAGEPFDFIAGSVPEPGGWPTGCRFSPRCSRSTEACTEPATMTVSVTESCVRCHHPGTEVLA
ncbi:MAG: ATP-binding cassette domain-containing protein [Actinobacteria bacterium]|uniref:Unannotated protein n=1 Tax=freshwater metagenome TaxID=449393 RepID=A0A6J7IP91_9ZZZZ|nr:ATP-binding cassette domain-containing protein [Actinomycetota bacterium]